MESNRVTVFAPVMHKKNQLVNRKRLGLTVSPETVKNLEKLVADGEAENISRMVDFLTSFFMQNRSALQVHFSNAETKAKVSKAALSVGLSPGAVLEALAERHI